MISSLISPTAGSQSCPSPPLLDAACRAPWSRSLDPSLRAPRAGGAASSAPHSQTPAPNSPVLSQHQTFGCLKLQPLLLPPGGLMLSQMSIFYLPARESDLPAYQTVVQLELIQMDFPDNLFSWVIQLISAAGLSWVNSFYWSFTEFAPFTSLSPLAVIPTLSRLKQLYFPPKHKENRIRGISLNLRPS